MTSVKTLNVMKTFITLALVNLEVVFCISVYIVMLLYVFALPTNCVSSISM